jgi:hypothetical protein
LLFVKRFLKNAIMSSATVGTLRARTATFLVYTGDETIWNQEEVGCRHKVIKGPPIGRRREQEERPEQMAATEDVGRVAAEEEDGDNGQKTMAAAPMRLDRSTSCACGKKI